MSDVLFTLIERGKKHNARPSTSLIEAWREAFPQHLDPADQQQFSFVESSLEKLETPLHQFDCVVSPANSYGIMDGGFDYYLSVAFSPKGDVEALTRLVQSAIRSRYYGFIPPGSCLLVPGLPTNRFGCKIIAVCPTMRYPIELQWHEDIVYNTMWALLAEIEKWNDTAEDPNKIKRVLMSGLGTGVGKIAPDTCAQQMALAVKHFFIMKKKEIRVGDHLHWSDVLPMAKKVA